MAAASSSRSGEGQELARRQPYASLGSLRERIAMASRARSNRRRIAQALAATGAGILSLILAVVFVGIGIGAIPILQEFALGMWWTIALGASLSVLGVGLVLSGSTLFRRARQLQGGSPQ